MGIWSSHLYGNDTTTDVRDSYQELIYETLDIKKAYVELMKEYDEYLGTNEEALVWYAIADLQWRYGRLMPEVKEKALYWIENDGGVDLWEENPNGAKKFRNNIIKLRNKLLSPMPNPKRISNPNNFVHNPWNVGDVYAFQFVKDELSKHGLKGKYVVIKKIGDTKPEGSKKYPCSVIQVFNKVFDAIPTMEEVQNYDLLTFDAHERFEIDNKRPPIQRLIMELYKKNDFKPNRFFFIDNDKTSLKKIFPWNNWEVYAWGYYFEDYIIEHYVEWQKYNLMNENGKYFVTLNGE